MVAYNTLLGLNALLALMLTVYSITIFTDKKTIPDRTLRASKGILYLLPALLMFGLLIAFRKPY